MTGLKKKGGKRIDRSYAQKRRSYSAYSRLQQEQGRENAAGKRKTSARRQEQIRLWQLVVSAAILVLVVAVKLAAPQTLEGYRERLLQLMGEDTDFVEAFSAVGRAVGLEEGLEEALNDAYTAVFGSQEVPVGPAGTAAGLQTTSASVDTPDTLPENVSMLQQVLGFDYANPVAGTLTERFGYRLHPIDGDMQFHYGLDLEAAEGTVITSFADGKVTAVGESSALGKYVTVLHEGGFTTLYAHCSRITASSGQLVRMSDPIAEVGQTGEATGPHLHFELYRDTTYFNPIYYVTV